MIALNQNQFVALSFEELVSIDGGLSPWAQKVVAFIEDLTQILVKVTGAVLAAYGTYRVFFP